MTSGDEDIEGGGALKIFYTPEAEKIVGLGEGL